MKNTTILTMVTVIVTVILTTSVLVPVIEEAQNVGVKKTVTFTNEGESLIEGNVSDTYNMQWDNALPGTIKINNPSPTVYFVAGTGATVSPESKTVVKDLTYGELPVPVKYGYSFDGWFSDEQYTTQVVSTDIVGSAGNIFLYAKWTAGQYTVTFDADGGSVSPSTKTVTFGSAYGELPVPEYTGHIFGGWVDANDNPITSQTIVSIGENHTLTAVWTLDQYLISFTTDGHGTVDVPSVTVDFGTAYTISDNTITIGSTTVTATPSSGYAWSHWTPVNVSGTVGGAMTFIANFELGTRYTVTFTANSPGSVNVQTYTDILEGTQYTVSDNVITISGKSPVTATLPNNYYFIGWNVAQGTGTITGDTTFTANYEEIVIADIVASNHVVWLITDDGKLFGCGQGTSGQFGDGNTTNRNTFLQSLPNETVSTISFTDVTTWVVTTDGKLFGCGTNAYGQQGSGDTLDVTTFTQRLTNETIAQVSSSVSSTWVVTTDGKLFGCGSDGSGQQGNGSGRTDVTTFTQRLSNETIREVRCEGGFVTWVITTDGKLFGCGSNSKGQQGDGTTTNIDDFTQRLTGETVSSVKCNNGTVTWVLTTDGKLYGCGTNDQGQQGDGTTTAVKTFTQRMSGYSIKDYWCSGSTTWVLTTDGKVYGCGLNNAGQQGSGNTTTVKTFTQRLDSYTISDISASKNTTWVLSNTGAVFGCGKNGDGQQGSNNTTDVTSFYSRVGSYNVAKIIGTDITTWILTTDGKVLGCGDNTYGQQGDGTTTDVKKFTQKAPTGSIKLSSINLNQSLSLSTPRSVPLASPIMRSAQSPQISDTTYTYLAGGSDWMLCSMVTDQNENALVLYSEDLAEPLVWTDDLVILTFSNGVMAVEKDGTDYEISYTSIFFKGDGKYILLNDTAYVTESTPILGYAMTDDGMIGASGTMNSMAPFTMSGITLGDATAITEESEYEGAYLLSGVDIGYGSDSIASCTSIILPKSVNAIVTVEDTTLLPLLWVVPVLILAGIVLFIVRSMMNRYD